MKRKKSGLVEGLLDDVSDSVGLHAQCTQIEEGMCGLFTWKILTAVRVLLYCRIGIYYQITKKAFVRQ